MGLIPPPRPARQSNAETLRNIVAAREAQPRRPSVEPITKCGYCGASKFTGFRCDGCGAYK